MNAPRDDSASGSIGVYASAAGAPGSGARQAGVLQTQVLARRKRG